MIQFAVCSPGCVGCVGREGCALVCLQKVVFAGNMLFSESTLANSAAIAALITAAQTHNAAHRFPAAATNTVV